MNWPLFLLIWTLGGVVVFLVFAIVWRKAPTWICASMGLLCGPAMWAVIAYHAHMSTAAENPPPLPTETLERGILLGEIHQYLIDLLHADHEPQGTTSLSPDQAAKALKLMDKIQTALKWSESR